MALTLNEQKQTDGMHGDLRLACMLSPTFLHQFQLCTLFHSLLCSTVSLVSSTPTRTKNVDIPQKHSRTREVIVVHPAVNGTAATLCLPVRMSINDWGNRSEHNQTRNIP